METVPQVFIDWLTEKMEERGWGMRETAKRAGLSHTPLSYILSNREPPSFETCRALGRTFNFPVDSIMRMAGLIPRIKETEISRELLHLFNQVHPDDQKFFIDVLRAWLKNKHK